MEAIAKHDFSATADDELSFRKLQVLKDLEQSNNRTRSQQRSLPKQKQSQQKKSQQNVLKPTTADNLKITPSSQENVAKQNQECVKKKILPSLGEPGGIDDPLRKGLSGAGVKWYLRFLQQGITPAEARKKVDQRKTESTNSVKNITAQPENSDHHSKTANVKETVKMSKPSYRAVVSSVRVAIVPKEYPLQILSSEQLTYLEEIILNMVAKGHTTALIFEGIHFRPGFMMVDCKDDATADWLREKISNLENWKGSQLRICIGDDMPRMYCITLFLPKSKGQSIERTLALFKAQNGGVNTALWKVTSCKEQEKGQLMNAIIDDSSRLAIETNGCALNYRFGKIAVRFGKGETAP